MEYIYKPTEYEIKLIILYTIKSLKVSANYTLLDYVISSAANVNYFDLEQYIASLIDKNNLMEYEADGNIYFSITDSGEECIVAETQGNGFLKDLMMVMFCVVLVIIMVQETRKRK